MRAQVIVLAGPSGSGKSGLAERLGLPVLRLDDFYTDGDDATLPHLDLPVERHPAAGHADAAVSAVEDLLAPALDRVTTFQETKTVWHPMGI